MEALRDKVPFEAVEEGRVAALAGGEDAATPTDGGPTTVPEAPGPTAAPSAEAGPDPESVEPETVEPDAEGSEATSDPDAAATGRATAGDAVEGDDAEESDAADDDEPSTIAAHVRAVIGGDGDGVRLLDGDAAVLDAGPADDAFDLLEDAESVPATVVVDGPVTQRLLDLAAQRGVERVVGAEEGEFVKRPSAVRVLTAEDVLE